MEEVRALQAERSSLQAETAQLKTRVDELRDELVTQKRRQAINIKDLTKQLSQGQRTHRPSATSSDVLRTLCRTSPTHTRSENTQNAA